MAKLSTVALLCAGMGLVGCDLELESVEGDGLALDEGAVPADGADEELGSVVQHGQNLNGQNLNGQNLNGQNLNGQNLNGQNLNTSELGRSIAWVERAGARHVGAAYSVLTLAGSQIQGSIGSSLRTGTQLVGAELDATSDTGEDLTLRIVHVTPPPAGSDVWRYGVEYRETDASWQPICLDPVTGAPTEAVALAGYWSGAQGVAGGGDKIADASRMSFACPKVGAIGKCVDMGYRPWASVGATSLDDHHEACVRMIRNDYCGDGTTHTVDGNVINVHDGVGIQSDTESWIVEAEWNKDGARCLTVNNRAPLALLCRLQLTQLTCGWQSHFATGTKLISERPLLGLVPSILDIL